MASAQRHGASWGADDIVVGASVPSARDATAATRLIGCTEAHTALGGLEEGAAETRMLTLEKASIDRSR